MEDVRCWPIMARQMVSTEPQGSCNSVNFNDLFSCSKINLNEGAVYLALKNSHGIATRKV
jgi:hypothetical protein